MGNLCRQKDSFWVSRAASESLDAKVYRIKSLSKFGIFKEGACETVVLILLKAFFSSLVHLNCAFCLTIYCSGLTVWAKSGTNLRTKFMVPMKDFIPFLLWGKGICSISLILSGSMEIPCFETMWPNNFPSVTANTHFLGLSEMPYL